MAETPQLGEQDFGVLAEVKGREKPLFMFKLTFARLIDDIVFPHESGKPFFVDGILVSGASVERLKILRLGKRFDGAFYDLNRWMTRGPEEMRRLYGEQYSIRLEALLRDTSEDVTSQVISAFCKTIKPHLKDYLPKREALIQATWTLFFEGLNKLAGLGLKMAS